MFNRIQHFAFIVRTVDSSQLFYQEHFGFKVRVEMVNQHRGLEIVFFPGDSELELIETIEPSKISGCHVA